MRTFAVTLTLALITACSKPASDPNPPTTTTAAEADGGEQPGGEQPDVDSGSERPGISAADCESQGGTVVGDIGDGAIHKPDYLCESGEPPIGTITADPDGPVAVEGSVCCK